MQHGMFAANAPSGVTCPWCKHYWQPGAVGVECGNCGGPLPPPPGPTRGHGPPPAPRHLPEKYSRDVLLWKNVGAMVGTFFAAFGGLFGVLGLGLLFVLLPLGLGFAAFGVLFGGIGLALRNAARRSALRQIAALTHGHPSEGQIIAVSSDTSESINGRHPFRIEYVFQVNGQPVGGSTRAWDIVNALRRPGEPLWVVFLPNDPSANSIWPPIT